jgi:hypothetical protein
MANANGSGATAPREDDDPDRTQRVPAGMTEVVGKWFGDDPQPATQAPMRVFNRAARRMNEQMANGKPTTGRRGGCLPLVLAPIAVAALASWAVR